MLAWTIYLSFIGAVAVTLTPGEEPGRCPPHRAAHGTGRVGDCDRGCSCRIDRAN